MKKVIFFIKGSISEADKKLLMNNAYLPIEVNSFDSVKTFFDLEDMKESEIYTCALRTLAETSQRQASFGENILKVLLKPKQTQTQ